MRLAGVLSDDRRDWLRHAVSGNPWSFDEAAEDLEIAPIVSPLRFDITLRAGFMRFYKEQRELYRDDFERFAALARDNDYFVWFRYVMCVNWQPQVLRDERLFAAAWAERLRSSASLVDSFERTGFDSRYPITLYAGRQVLETGTGKRVSREVYAGDGNHRIALLLAAGETKLRPGQFRIKRFRSLQPADTTPELLSLLKVREESYFEFLRYGYPSLRVRRVGGRIELEGVDPAVEAEVRSILEVDAPHLRGQDRVVRGG